MMKNYLNTILQETETNVNASQFDKLIKYADILKNSIHKSYASWDDDKKGMDMHFKDTFLNIPKVQVNNFLDIGSGAGIPGIIYSILWSDVSAVLIDSRLQRINFLKALVNELDLNKRVNVLCKRAETFAHDKNYREKFDLVTARALAPIEQFIEYSVGFVKENGYLHAIRGINDRISLIEYQNILDYFYLTLEKDVTYKLNDTTPIRWSAIFRKTKITDSGFPRSLNKIKCGLFRK
ncbi:MAG: Ribosomal RNA small subunit methyltransferase G [uncultured bacterium]|nr:MAG: Ribosomal RNA small subunit methyltransferase G [uncultured bacterium]